MSVRVQFSLEDLRLKLFPLSRRLQELSEKEQYDYEYYSIHRTINNLIKHGYFVTDNGNCYDLWEYIDDIFYNLSNEEVTYVRSPENLIEWPNIVIAMKNFKSPMKYSYTQQKSWKIHGMERRNGTLNPYCVHYFLRDNPCDEYEITDAILEEIDTSLGYWALAKRSTDPMVAMKYLLKSLDRQEKEYESMCDYTEDLLEVFETIKSKVKKAEETLDALTNRPPHQITCGDCGNCIEVHCSEETKDIKSHFESIV